MRTQNRKATSLRSSAWSRTAPSTSSLAAKRHHAVSSENAVGRGKGTAAQPPMPPNFAQKRPPLGNLTNQPRRSSSGASASMHGDGHSVSVDESMSSRDSLKSLDIEYLDENDVAAVQSIGSMASNNLHITEQGEQTAGNICKRDKVREVRKVDLVDNVVTVDNDFMDPQICATIACDIYKHLHASEATKRPSTDFMEKIQKDINASMRAILFD